METGEDIRRARVEAGLSQAELAERIGREERTVRRWENGETKAPPPPVIEMIKRALLGAVNEPRLSEASPAQLFGELARRWEEMSEDVAAIARRWHASDSATQGPPTGPSAEPLGIEEGPVPEGMWQDPDLIEGQWHNSQDTGGGRQSGTRG